MNRDFSQLTKQVFDVLVCGGGIYGAWTAYDAALRGLKVALLDQADWASATSSASSKLVHGGLRYLETLDFKLVKKALAERQMLMHAAPHRVWPLRFGIPVFKNGRLSNVKLKLGLLLYDSLAGLLTQPQKHRYFNREQFSALFPALDNQQLKNGFSYLDAQTDDARYVLEIVAGAMAAGAVCLNYCQVADIKRNAEQDYEVDIVDQVANQTGQLRARSIVKTTGPWAALSADAQLSKGVHLVLPKLLTNEALLLTAEVDGRVFFLIPWYGRTLLGTTDTAYTGDIEQLQVEQTDIDYLLNAANHVLKTVHWTQQDIVGQCVGLRVLKQLDATSPSAASRDWHCQTDAQGVFISVGGKLTSAREDAAQIANAVCAKLAINQPCRTWAKPFPWRPDAGYESWYGCTLAQAIHLGLTAEIAHCLISRHGRRVHELLQLLTEQPDTANQIHPELPFITADLLFCAQQEMVVHLDDLLRRRMPALLLARFNTTELLHLARLAGLVLGWDEHRIAAEVKRCESIYES